MNREMPLPSVGPGECGFFCGICLCRCQDLFEESHRVEILVAIKLLNKKQRKNGEGEAKKLEEKSLAVVSRDLVDGLENNLVWENQMPNRRSGIEFIQDAKTNTTLDQLSNPLYATDLSLHRKVTTENTLTVDVRIHDSDRGSGATVEAMLAAGGEEAKVVSISQACQMLKERAKGGAPKDNEDYTPNDCNFSKNSGIHHWFSWNKLSERQIDVAQVSMGAAVGAGFTAAAQASASTIDAFDLRTRKRATKKMLDLTTTLRTKKRAGLCALCSHSANLHT
jgi:hypothetical protein